MVAGRDGTVVRLADAPPGARDRRRFRDAPTVELPEPGATEPGPPDPDPGPDSGPGPGPGRAPESPGPVAAWPVEPPGEEPTETALRPEEPPSADR